MDKMRSLQGPASVSVCGKGNDWQGGRDSKQREMA